MYVLNTVIKLNKKIYLTMSSEALAVHNWWSRFIIFLLCNPHWLKGRQRCQNGAEIYSRSDISIWPMILVINEIELKKRFSLEYIIVAGLFVGSKQNFEILMKPIVAQLKSLEYGLLMKQNNFSKKILRFFLLFGVFDKPARASILNTKSSNGFYIDWTKI